MRCAREPIVHHKRRCIARSEQNTLANQPRRFAQKAGFGEWHSDAKPVGMKIFLLPKTATQSPCNALSAGVD
jgi:hypothetical protein